MSRPRNFFKIYALILAGLAVSPMCVCETKRNSTNRPLIYLIPAEYVGPVFVFFGQNDGVETMSGPLGNAVRVPTNGVVKLKARSTDLIGNDEKNKRNIYWVQELLAGQRRVMIVNNNTSVTKSGDSADSYYDEHGVLQHHSQKGAAAPFYYFNLPQKNERMIFEHGSCKHQKFSAPTEPEANWPACGKFLVISPNEYFKKPAWLWDETSEDYDSIAEFEIEANARARKIKALVK